MYGVDYNATTYGRFLTNINVIFVAFLQGWYFRLRSSLKRHVYGIVPFFKNEHATVRKLTGFKVKNASVKPPLDDVLRKVI